MANNRCSAFRFILIAFGFTSNEYFNHSSHSQLSHQNYEQKHIKQKEPKFRIKLFFIQRWIGIRIHQEIACTHAAPNIRTTQPNIPVSFRRSVWFVHAIWNFLMLEHSKNTWKNRIPKRVHSEFWNKSKIPILMFDKIEICE